ncbi:MAG: histidinol-phosphate transaminase [Spirochaetaceae bacterium 4572_59]|nr:MAG: histidinol-phosphate transaminase [Spirochaetaceae bacterium 4572_59]
MKIRKTLESVKPYVAGRTRPGAVKLSSNENPLGPSPKALTAISSELNHLHRYPDGVSGILRETIASHHNLTADYVIAGNGSDEIFAMIAGTYLEEGFEVITAKETFSEYNFSGLLYGGHIKKVPLQEGKYDLKSILDQVTEKTSLIFVCNPNNPTGTYLKEKELKEFLDALPSHVLTILDEAYGEFATAEDFPSGQELIKSNKRLIVTHTFSKLYGLAGLRIGYALADPTLIEQIFRTKQAFNVNILAQQAGTAALGDQNFISRTLDLCKKGKTFLYGELKRLGYDYYPSQANFICIRVKRDSRAVFDHFLDEGMAIRPLASFGLDEWIRYTIGTEDQNREFIRIMSELEKA